MDFLTRAVSNPAFRYAVHSVGVRGDDIWTGPISGRNVFASREARRAFLDPRQRPTRSKWTHGGIVPVVFGAEDRRCAANVLGSDPWVWLDFDGLPDETGARFADLRDLTGEFFSSYSFGAKPGARVRMVLETDRVLAEYEIEPARAGAAFIVAERLGLDPVEAQRAKIIDPACFRPAQFFATPAHHPDREAFFFTIDGGNVLRADALLERGRAVLGAKRTRLPVGIAADDYEPNDDDFDLAAEDLADVCRLIRSWRGDGFESRFFPHGRRLGDRIALGQLDSEDAARDLSAAIASGLESESDESGQLPENASQSRREGYFARWLSGGRFNPTLISPRLTFGGRR